MSLIAPIPTFVHNSLIYKEFLEEREEILKHKWLESEKKGYDIGFDQAICEWVVKYRKTWKKVKKQEEIKNN